MAKIIASSYEESRLEFFETLKKYHERMLHWWKNQKPYKKGYEHCDPMYIHSKCSYHGAAIQYCEDAIKALQENVRHGEWIVDDLGRAHCSICRKRLPTVKQYYADCDDLEEDTEIDETEFCPNCGAKMDSGKEADAHA